MKDLLLAILNIFKGVWKIFAFFRSLILNVILITVLAVVVISFLRTDKTTIVPDSILKLSITGDIVEQQPETNPFDDSIGEYLGFSAQTAETMLQDILDAIQTADDDPNINAILLDLSLMGNAGMNQLAEIGHALNTFRKSGKPVIAAEDNYTQSQYYLAAHADKVFLNPMGFVQLTGFGMYRLYFQEALEKLKINYHVFRVGSYKSAVEPFIRNAMSPEDRRQTRSWLTSLWNNYVAEVARQRELETADILAYINTIPDNLRSVGGNPAKLALKTGLVDEIATHHEIEQYLASLSDGPHLENEYQEVSFNKYLTTFTPSYIQRQHDKDAIAVIVAQGTIIPGVSAPGIIGAKTVAELLQDAGSSDDIKGVVLRIDSGGGSAFASEIIRQEILEFRKKKPLVVSMGTLAASGAYWLSANADEIWASADTLTGSIGIFMALPTFEKLLDYGGVHRDGVGTTNLSGALDVTRPLSAEVKEALQLSLENGYNTFLSIVSEGREIPMERVKEIAQGRVFTGNAAQLEGLVDRIGTLNQAISSAAELAGLTDYQTYNLLPPASFKEKILQQFGTDLSSRVIQSIPFLSQLKRIVPAEDHGQSLLLFNDPNNMYAHCMITYY